MNWPGPDIDESSLLKDDVAICNMYAIKALQISFMKRISLGLSPETYVDKYFGGVQPTGPEFLQFLSGRGFDSNAIHKDVLEGIRKVKESQSTAKENATIFFNLFLTEWFVAQDDVEKYIDHYSISYLLEIAVKNAASTMARIAAKKRHAETIEIKAVVFKWLDDNGATYEGRGKGKGIEAAARAIAKQQPIVHATARDWYKQWKKLHPASTL